MKMGSGAKMNSRTDNVEPDASARLSAADAMPLASPTRKTIIIGSAVPLHQRLEEDRYARPNPYGTRAPDGAREFACIPDQIRDDAKTLLDHVRQQAEEAGALDRLGEFALLLLRDGGDAGRNDL